MFVLKLSTLFPYLGLLTVGLTSGFLAGLIGIGGGFVAVPSLLFILPLLGIEQGALAKVAVATSLAAMIPTALSALLAQHRHGSLDFDAMKSMVPAAAVGGACGAIMVGYVNSVAVAIIFAAYAAWVAKKLLWADDTRVVAASVASPAIRLIHGLPGWVPGVFIGGFSALAGVGGASMTIPYMLSKGIDIRKAAAVASAVGLSAALASSATNASSGSHYVVWFAALLLSLPAFFTAPIGVKLAHSMPPSLTKKAFGVVTLSAVVATLYRVF